MKFHQKAFSFSCYAITAAIVALLFFENFIFSSQLAYLSFREVDDLAFQYSIRQVHLNMLSGSITKLLIINDYAYGWIFWIAMSIISFPLFLLSYFGGIDWPLIVLPRQISLLLAVFCLLILRKILKRFGLPEWGCAGAVLMFVLLPFTGYFSMRFGTVNAVMFFAMLSFYLAIRGCRLNYCGLIGIAIALAIAGAIKPTGLLITPLIIFFVYKRLSSQLDVKISIGQLVRVTAIFFFMIIVLTAPQLLFSLFRPSLFHAFKDNLEHFIGVARIPSGPIDPFNRFYHGALGTPGVALIYSVLTLGLFLGAIRGNSTKKYFSPIDFFAILGTLLLVGAYLLFAVKNTLSLGSYFTCVSFLFFIGLSPLLKRIPSASIWVLIMLNGILVTDLFWRANSELEKKSTAWGHMSYFIKKENSIQQLEIAQKTIACISSEQPLEKIKHLLLDYSAPSLVNVLTLPHARITWAWNDLYYKNLPLDNPPDFMVLDEKSVGYLPDQQFNERLQSTTPSIADGYRRDRNSRALLVSNGQFGDHKYSLLCDFGEIKVFMLQR